MTEREKKIAINILKSIVKKHYSSLAELARELGITSAQPSKWSRGITPIPVAHALRLSKKYKVSIESLRPDIFKN